MAMADMLAAALVIARRELRDRVTSRGFQVSAALVAVATVAVIVLPTLVGPEERSVGVVGSVAAAHKDLGREIAGAPVTTYSSDAQAEAAVAEGEVDIAVTGSASLMVADRANDAQVAAVEATVKDARIRGVLRRSGLAAARVELAMRPVRLEVVATRAGSGVPSAVLLLLFAQLTTYGYWVASAVVEEKSSHVLEVMLTAVRPWQILLGKLLGLGALAVLHTGILGAVAVAAATQVDLLELNSSLLGQIGLLLLAFLGGYGIYASLFIAGAALVSKPEDLGNVTAPVQILLTGALLLSVRVMDDPESLPAMMGSLMPFTSPVVLAARHSSSEGASPVLLAAAACLWLLTVVVFLRLATWLYAATSLAGSGRIRLRAVIRTAGRGTTSPSR
jgi:ABC-2 type transport system permease protein